MDFGMIRSLAQAPPSKDAWEELCKTLDRTQEPRDLERALGYLEGALRRWPRAWRVVPQLWRSDMMGEGKEAMRVARVGVLKQSQSGHIASASAARGQGMRHLDRLELVSYGGDIVSLTTLLGVDGLKGLRELELSSMRLSGRSNKRSFLSHIRAFGACVNAHERLETFELRGTKTFDATCYAALLEHPLGLKALTIERSGLTSDQMKLIAGQVRSGLERLDLGGNDLGDEGWSALAAQDLSGLRSLRLDRTRGGDVGARALAARPMPDLEQLALIHVSMGEVGVAAWLSAPLERLRDLELDLSGEHAALAAALSAARGMEKLERLMLRFNTDDDEKLCDALADVSVFRGARDVNLSQLSPEALATLLRSAAFEGVERLTLDLVEMTDEVWEALVSSEHLSRLTDLTVFRSDDASLDGPGYGRFCAADGLRALQRLTYDRCKWNGLSRLANSARVGTLTSLTLRNSAFDEAELVRLFANEGVARMERFELCPNRLMTKGEAMACLNAEHHPSEWSPPFAALKAFSRAEAREARSLWSRW